MPMDPKEFESYLASLAPQNATMANDASSPDQLMASIPKVSDMVRPAPVRAVPSPAVADRAPAVVPPSDISGSVKETIAKKYGLDPSLSLSALQDAQRQSGKNTLYANLSEVGSDLAHSLSGSKAPVDNKIFDSLRAQADQPVQDIVQGRKTAIEDEAVKRNLEDNDKDSVKATIMRKQLAPLAQKSGLDASDLNGLSMKDMKEFVAGPMEFAAKLKLQEENNKSNNDVKKLLVGQKVDAAEDKKNQKGEENYTKLIHDVESFRGNGTVRQASLDQYSASKAMSLLKGRDPNTLTTQDLSLLSGELAKIATGGVPTEHGMQSLMPSNLQTKYAELQNFLASKPSNAQAGEYVKRNIRYLDDMVNESKKVVDNYRRNIIRSYKGRVSDNNYKEALGNYGLSESAQPDAMTAPTNAPAVTAPPPPAGNDMVNIKLPDGRTGTIPKANLDKAISKGAQVL